MDHDKLYVFSLLKGACTHYFMTLATTTTGIKAEPHYWANRAGTMAASQLPIMTALGMRNNLVSSEY